MNYNESRTTQKRDLHLQYNKETGHRAPKCISQYEARLYIEWLEEKLERRLEKEQEDINIVSFAGSNPRKQEWK